VLVVIELSPLFGSSPTTEQLEMLDVTRVPVFDHLLPFYSELVHLTVSATEISNELFRIGLPPKLESITVQAFNHKGESASPPRSRGARQSDERG
jgi:hypothetical protein